jgi:hypothetical protein
VKHGLTLWEEHILRVSEKNVFMRILGPERDEAAGGWTELCAEKYHNLK